MLEERRKRRMEEYEPKQSKAEENENVYDQKVIEASTSTAAGDKKRKKTAAGRNK